MADPIYNLKEKPEYEKEIPALTTQTPAHAETALRPLFESMINNTEYVRQRTEAVAERVEEVAEATGELTPGDIGADPAGSAAAVDAKLTSHVSAANPHSGSVPTSRTVAGKPLSANVTLAAGDVGADPAGSAAGVQANLNTHTSAANPHSGSVPTGRTINGKALTGNVTLAATDVGAVPTSRTINGKALTGNVTLAAGDVNAVPITGGTMTGQLIAQDSSTASKRVRNIQISTTDIGVGGTLASGVIYFVYEN